MVLQRMLLSRLKRAFPLSDINAALPMSGGPMQLSAFAFFGMSTIFSWKLAWEKRFGEPLSGPIWPFGCELRYLPDMGEKKDEHIS